jgi:hypothetical protein
MIHLTKRQQIFQPMFVLQAPPIPTQRVQQPPASRHNSAADPVLKYQGLESGFHPDA